MTNDAATTKLALLLSDKQEGGLTAKDLPAELKPSDLAQAYAVQQQILRLRNEKTGGWKVGAPSPEAEPRCSPLPVSCVIPSPASLPQKNYAHSGLELEIAFRFSRSFLPSEKPYSPEQVIQGIGEMGSAIEVVTSRFSDWPDVDKLLQLADLQNHGGLVVSEFVPFDAAYPFEMPEGKFAFDGTPISPARLSNPAGNPLRLLVWFVNHRTSNGFAVEAGTVVTTGSYTGMYFSGRPGLASGGFAGLPPVQLNLV